MKNIKGLSAEILRDVSPISGMTTADVTAAALVPSSLTSTFALCTIFPILTLELTIPVRLALGPKISRILS